MRSPPAMTTSPKSPNDPLDPPRQSRTPTSNSISHHAGRASSTLLATRSVISRAAAACGRRWPGSCGAIAFAVIPPCRQTCGGAGRGLPGHVGNGTRGLHHHPGSFLFELRREITAFLACYLIPSFPAKILLDPVRRVRGSFQTLWPHSLI